MLIRLSLIYLLPWDTYSWVIFVVVLVGYHSKFYYSELASPLLYIPKQIIRVRVYIYVFHDIIFHYNLTVNRTLTIGYIKCTTSFSFTGSFLDIVFGQYVRQGMVGKLPPKTRNDSVVSSFCLEFSPMVSCLFCEEWEAGLWNKYI